MAKAKRATQQMRDQAVPVNGLASADAATAIRREAVPAPKNRAEATAQMKAIVLRHSKALRALAKL